MLEKKVLVRDRTPPMIFWIEGAKWPSGRVTKCKLLYSS
jgi:hypothetical protein